MVINKNLFFSFVFVPLSSVFSLIPAIYLSIYESTVNFNASFYLSVTLGAGTLFYFLKMKKNKSHFAFISCALLFSLFFSLLVCFGYLAIFEGVIRTPNLLPLAPFVFALCILSRYKIPDSADPYFAKLALILSGILSVLAVVLPRIISSAIEASVKVDDELREQQNQEFDRQILEDADRRIREDN